MNDWFLFKDMNQVYKFTRVKRSLNVTSRDITMDHELKCVVKNTHNIYTIFTLP